MKCETTNAILTFVLGVFAVAGVIFALQAIFLNRELRSLTQLATRDNSSFLQIQAPTQSLINDVMAYNQRNPSAELTKLLQPTQAKPATK